MVKTTLTGAFESQPATRKGPRCSVAIMLLKMDPTDREAVIAAFNNDALRSKFIAQQLTKNGWLIHGHTIARHRRKDCTCP